jgi:hypothetical protein
MGNPKNKGIYAWSYRGIYPFFAKGNDPISQKTPVCEKIIWVDPYRVMIFITALQSAPL